MEKFEKGELITWTVGNIVSKASVLEDKGDKLEVFTHTIGNRIDNIIIEIEK